MLDFKTKIHQNAFLTNFEIACEAGVLALLGDVIWLIHDAVSYGFSFWYGIVLTGLLGGLILTVFALYRHHMSYTHRFAKRLHKRSIIN